MDGWMDGWIDFDGQICLVHSDFQHPSGETQFRAVTQVPQVPKVRTSKAAA